MADPLPIEQGSVHAGTRSSSMAWHFNRLRSGIAVRRVAMN
jgi:hypothetical protein